MNEPTMDDAIAAGGAALNNKSACLWLENDLGIWETECGHTFEITAGNDEFRWCPYCGSPIHSIGFFESDDRRRQ